MHTNITIASDHNLFLDTHDKIIDAIGACYGSEGLLLTENDVGEAFFNIETRFAGELFQKFATYRTPLAFVLEDFSRHGKRFQELASEHSNHKSIRFFHTVPEAVDWLSSQAETDG
mgnify:CR=1 FL=1